MMKSFLLKMTQLALFPLIAVGVGELRAQAPSRGFEQPPIPGRPPLPGKVSSMAGKVSLGVSVVKPGSALYSQLPELPAGCGFFLKSVTPNGTADKAGLKVMDLIWKLDGQLLINEAQMMVLLSHQSPGDKVTVSYFRSGVAKEVELDLQPWSAESPHPDFFAMEAPLQPSLPMRVISYEDRSASISDKTGTATLTYREGKPWLHVETDKGEEIFNAFVSAHSEIALVPAIWRSRLPVLKRSLEESIRMRRLPRVRHVPRAVPKQRVVGGE